MGGPTKRQIVDVLLSKHGRTFAEELGIPVERNTPASLYRLLCASLLFSARIGWEIAERAAQALWAEGWTTAEKMSASTWEERAGVLNRSGYARYDERTATMLGQSTSLLLDRYRGDLRNLREQAGRNPDLERKLLKEFKGIGDTGVDIFFREVQVAWDEIFPFADSRALNTAEKLGLDSDAHNLLRLAGRSSFPRLIAALVRASLQHDLDDVFKEAGEQEPGPL